ncbi:MAG TPA: hypothetical protein VFN09_15570 [Rhodanobacteraceae bacterium]|nr:hypothetical protein [Rhodanobacteraceae bacterium]
MLHWEFRRQRMSRRGWALLCRFGAALWWPLRHCHEFHRDPVSLITTWVNLIAATGRRDVPPATLALAFGRLHSMGQGSARADNGWTILVDRAWKQLDALPGGSARAAFARGPLEAVFVWWHVARVTTRLPRNVGWKWLQRSAANARLVDGGAAVAWRSFGDFARVGRYRVEPLRTLAAVRRAGIELHNCMSQATAAEGAAAKSVLFVLRHGASGRAVAMFTVRPARLGRVVVTMARGPCNLPVPEAHHRAMEAYLRGLNWLAWVQKHCKS